MPMSAAAEPDPICGEPCVPLRARQPAEAAFRLPIEEVCARRSAAAARYPGGIGRYRAGGGRCVAGVHGADRARA
eukprot:1434649-Prymnesium_polylepis.1